MWDEWRSAHKAKTPVQWQGWGVARERWGSKEGDPRGTGSGVPSLTAPAYSNFSALVSLRYPT